MLRQNFIHNIAVGCYVAVCLVATSNGMHAQRSGNRRPEPAFTPAPVGTFDPLQTFAPLTLPQPVNVYRGSDGAPGPQYWQNRADYVLKTAIDTSTHTLTATETITYTNNSPNTLTSLWLNAEQNTYRKDSRAQAFASGSRRRSESGNYSDGYIFDSVEIQSLATAVSPSSKAHTVVSDTRLQIQLPDAAPLLPKGKIKILIKYHYTIPGEWGDRTSWVMAKQAEIYDIAQWYPRMCVYDDLRGWDTQPYLSNEFYLEYGNFDYFVTVPSNMIVSGSGELVNAAEVLTKEQLARWSKARNSDKTVMIRTAEEATAASTERPTTTKTWHFQMTSTRDVSFSASAGFLWDAARMNIKHDARDAGKPHPTGVQMAESVYPIESAGNEAWGRSTEYLKDSVEHFSQRWYPYPFPNAINVAGGSSGMEYPGILFDGIDDKGKELFWVTAHEIGHTWFPMLVGSNERRDAWIDEGFNTFIDIYESDDFEGGVYGPKRDGEYAPGGGYPADEIAHVISDPEAPILLTRADAIKERYRHPITYFKSAEGLYLLREQILGHERFDHAFQKFIRDWAFKHPSPSDFFRSMESEGGEDLSYFWRGWYLNNWQLDMAVTDATFDPSTPNTVRVTIANKGPLVLPALLRINLADGSHTDLQVPAETWMQNTSHVFTVTAPSKPTTVVLDPDHAIPDIDRSNNTLNIKP